jgi:hypothetical protein
LQLKYKIIQFVLTKACRTPVGFGFSLLKTRQNAGRFFAESLAFSTVL